MTARFPGWICLSDRVPPPGYYIVGLAGTDDVRVWHPSRCRWDGENWFNQYDRIMTPFQPERTFYKEFL